MDKRLKKMTAIFFLAAAADPFLAAVLLASLARQRAEGTAALGAGQVVEDGGWSGGWAGPGTEEAGAVALTFDDGPSARTDEILEILDKYGVKATFFVVGANEEGDLERMQKIVAAGHTLAIHSYSHDYKKIYASVEAYLEDFNQMFCQIYEATGVKPQIFRFPGGSVNSYNVGIHQQLIAEMTRRGCVYFDWKVAYGDAVFSKIQPSSALTANALKGVGTARRAIILMHDSSAKTTTVEALPAIIEGYLEAGYSFAALTPSTRSVTFSYLD